MPTLNDLRIKCGLDSKSRAAKKLTSEEEESDEEWLPFSKRRKKPVKKPIYLGKLIYRMVK